MIESLVITLREGIEAALVVGIILAYLNRTGRVSLNRYVYMGLTLAVGASLGVAAIMAAIGFDPENEVLEGTMLAIGGLFVASMVIWMWRAARNLRREMETRLDSIVSTKGGTFKGTGTGLLVFTFFMVFREGVETVLFLGAATLGETNILNFVGGALGLALATLFAYLFIRGSLRINLSRFFGVTSLVLLVLAAKLLAGSAHEFGEVGILPLTKEVMKVLGYFVRDNSSTAILMGLVAAPIFLVLWDYRPVVTPAPVSEENPAERRKRLAAAKMERQWRFGLIGVALAMVLAMAFTILTGAKFYDPVPMPVAAAEAEVRLSLAEMEVGRLHKFAYSVDDTPVRFLVVRPKAGTVTTALDACEICGAVGYMQEKDIVICKNCNAPIPMSTIGQGGGCNPLPLAARVENDTVIIQVKDLMAQSHLFK